MALPELIEIIPLDKPVRAEITVPGSKSITNRALILAALADGEVTLTGALWSEDTQVMTEALRALGFEVRVENDPAEFCNRTITVKGQGGKIPKAGTLEKPLELFVGNAGTAARFLAAMVCLGDGVYRLSGVPRMHERPQAALFQALRELGYCVDATNDKLPATIFGGRARHSVRAELSVATERRARSDAPYQSCTVSISESSQFASALLLSSKHGGWEVKVAGDDDEEAPYVTMTEKLIEVFPWGGGKFQIEPDASSGSYFWAAGWLHPICDESQAEKKSPISTYDLALFIKGAIHSPKFFSVLVNNWPKSDWQMDQWFPALLPEPPSFRGVTSRAHDMADSIMTAVVIAPFATTASKFTELGRLRVQECERVKALETELKKCGIKAKDYGPLLVTENGEVLVDETGTALDLGGFETLEVKPVSMEELHGAEIETYNDHRMAMCFAILGLKVPGIRLKNPTCVKKTFPNFFQKLAAPPPNGLGVEIWEVKDGKRTRKLEGEDLFAA